MFAQSKNIYISMQNQADVQNANKIELVVLVYDKVVFHINNAIKAINTNNLELKLHSINKALNIIELGLLSYLDLSQGDVAKNLESFYTSSMLVLTQSNINNNAKDLQKIADSFIELRDAWKNISEKQLV
jgi:flagellar biosynthetic protein FliS